MADEPENHDHAEESTPADSSLPPEQEERIVDKVVSKVKDVLSEIVGPGERSDGGDAEPPPGPASPAATEADMERTVREGVQREITARERKSAAAEARRAHDEEHERLRAAVEKPPQTFSRLTTAMWGSDDS